MTATKKPVLITAATRWEAGALARGLGLAPSGGGRPSPGGRFEGMVPRRRVVLVKTGMGAAKTTEALEGGFVAGDFELVISAGLCGAMQEDVKNGDIVADVAAVDTDFVAPLRETARALSAPFHFGKILHTNIILTPEEKRRLGKEQRSLACDMETAAVRRWAGEKTPAIGVRVVLDEVDEAVPEEVPEGETAAALARHALSHARTLPSMMRTGLRSSRALKRLSGFLTAYLEAL